MLKILTPTLIPLNNILVSLDSPVQSEYKKRGFKIFIDTKYNHEQHVSTTGKVAGLPKDNPYKGKLKNGDKIAFSYSVVANRTFKSDGENFFPHIQSNYMKQWISGTEERLNVICVPSIINKKWVFTYIDRNGKFVHGGEGTENEMERWLSQFSFGEVQTFEFENLITYQNRQYWKCDVDNVFAKIVKGKPKAIGNRLILKPIDVLVPEYVFSQMGVVAPPSAVYNREVGKAKVVSSNGDFSIKDGDIVGFDDMFIERYNFDGKDYYLLKSDKITSIYGE